MKVGVFTAPFADRPFVEVLDLIAEHGCRAVEIGTGGYPGDSHCNPRQLLKDAAARRRFAEEIATRGLTISALSCHGNPIHPDRDRARADDEAFRSSVELASSLQVDLVITFSGCPGGSEGCTRPNWITCAWPPEALETLEWQWMERIAPYWEEASDFARKCGVRVALEPHPGFAVYNIASFWRLREIAGSGVGVNLDPAHLLWQQANPRVGIRELRDAIFHVHAKDTQFDSFNLARNGVLDTTPYEAAGDRSWNFCTVAHGRDISFWRALVRELRSQGYEGVLSIEQDDQRTGREEGLAYAAAVLRNLIRGAEGDDMVEPLQATQSER